MYVNNGNPGYAPKAWPGLWVSCMGHTALSGSGLRADMHKSKSWGLPGGRLLGRCTLVK